MAYESKALIIAIFNYVKELDSDDAKIKILRYLQQLANADSAVLELPPDSSTPKQN